MRAADVASVVVFLALAGGAAGAFYYWRAEAARAEEQQYEAALDRIVERKLDAVRLDWLAAELAPHGAGKVDALRAMYADRARSDRLNLGFGTLRGDWTAAYASFAEQAGRTPAPGRLQAEVDERFGEGAYALMQAQYEAFLADAPRRQIEEDARRQRACEEQARLLGVRLVCVSREGEYAADGR
jgi:hypothetical protein